MFTVKYEGESSHLLDGIFANIDDGYDWFVQIMYRVGDRNEALAGTVKSSKIETDGPGSTVTIQPMTEDGLSDIGEPVTIRIEDIFDLLIPIFDLLIP